MLLLPGSAEAFSTRVRIAIANDLRESLIAAGDGTIPLKLTSTPSAVTLKPQDIRAIKLYPTAFRGGVVGPDNMAFPAMTDPSHALYQKPFVQCEKLYQSAANDEERAYALGCFAHGAADIVAHHFVNYLAGETFTLTPLAASRTTSYTNVVRHIEAENMVQAALLKAKPGVFAQNELTHTIPTAFVARTYFLTTSELYPYFAGPAQKKLADAKAAAPGKNLVSVAGSAELGVGDHLSLLPVYLGEIDGMRADTRAKLVKTIADLQDRTTTDGARLKVTPGPDGKLGTRDDDTSCSVTCASIYAKYFVSVGLLNPRKDAGGNVLPSAYDKISEKLGGDLRNFVPAYLATIERLSTRINTPLLPGSDAYDFSASEIPGLFQPMTNWADALTTIDYRTIANAVVPGWLLDIESALQSVNVNIPVPGIIEEILRPFVDPLKNLLKEKLVDKAKGYFEELIAQYKELVPPTKVEFTKRLDLAKDPTLQGALLDHLLESGLYAHSFNLSAAALAAHEAVLPDVQDTSSIQLSPVSFDTSYGPEWTQAGTCEYLRKDVFPLGLGAAALLTVIDKGGTRKSRIVDDSPVECHEGSLKAFSATPTPATCTLTNLPALRTSKQGSVSGGFPPILGSTMFSCRNITIPGLTLPPKGAGGTNEPNGSTPGKESADATGGCGCKAGPGTVDDAAAAWALGAMSLLGALVVARKRLGRSA